MKSWIIFILGAGLLSPLFAQTTGDLRGDVKDPARQIVAKALVSARSKATSVTRNVETDAAGSFSFTALPVGEYIIEVEGDGFKSYVQDDVNVTLGRVLQLEIQLEPGDSTEVRALDTPLVERTSTQLGAIVNSRLVVDLPLNARDTYQLLQLQPGVQSQQGYDLFAGSENPGVVSVNGGRGRANNFNVNGGNANDQFVGIPAIQPSPDSIEEFRVLTNLFDAEYGRNSGSIVNVVTRGATNDFHGSLFEFFRNRSLNTRGFFDTEKPKFNQNQFGGTFGGPIAKNRTFAFFSFEERKIRQGISSDVVVVPTEGERAGDFSAGTPFSGTLNDSFLADALNKRPGCAGAVAVQAGAPIQAGASWAAIFPGNRIPTQCFDATAADLLKQYVPLPNAGPNTLQTVPVMRNDAIQPTLRVDHSLTATNQLAFYYYLDDSTMTQPFSHFQGKGANVPGFGSSYASRFQQFNLADTWSVNAATINEARLTYFREGQLDYNHPQNTNLVQKSCATVSADRCFSDPDNPALGITPQLGARHEGVPSIQLGGEFSIGNNFEGELPQIGNSFHFADNLSKLAGRHHMKFGVDVRRQRLDQTLYFDVNGQFSFGAGGTNDVGAAGPLPNYLLGLPSSYSQGSAQSESVRSTGLSLFAQDSWNLSKSLTLNYGLRWELNTPLADAGHRVQTFRPGQATQSFPCQLNAGNPLVDALGTTDCGPGSDGESVFPLGLVLPGDKGVPDALTSTDYKAFAPRIGLAWSPDTKTSIRMGWGMFYNPVEQLVLEQFAGQPPFGGSTILSNSMFNTPFQGQDGSVSANVFHGILNPQRGAPLDWSLFRPLTLYGEMQPHLRAQYAANYNFTVQREFHKDLLLQVGYVGSQGHRLLATHDLNYGQAQPCLDLNALSQSTGDGSLACGPFSADSSYTIAAGQIPEGFTMHLPYGAAKSVTGPNPNPIMLVGLRRYSSPLCDPLTGKGCAPDGVPVFGSIFAQDTIANSSYNSFQASVEKRALEGLTFQAAYTFSKSIDNASSFEGLLNPLDYRLSRSLSNFDARHRLVFALDWSLPRVTGHKLAARVLNGWALSGILSMQSGFPVPITSSDDLELMNSGDFTYAGEPDRIKPVQRLDPRNPLHLAFDPAAFVQPQDLGRIGNSPRTVCCGPGINNLDLAVMKAISITERMSSQLRLEFFNTLNHAQFSRVDGDISDGAVADGGTFGQVLGARDPRLIQAALRIMF